jgi:hypothetical protein
VLIDATDLAIDMPATGERRVAQYVPSVPAPSVIALNTLATAEGVNHFMLAVTGLHKTDDTNSVIQLPRNRERIMVEHGQSRDCEWCAHLPAM